MLFRSAAADVDGDGRMDLFFTTVYETASFNVRNQPTLFLQTGEWQWQDRTTVTGLEGLPATYQAAWADFDQDGDPDLVTAGKLWINQRPKGNNWLSVMLRGDGTWASTNATGAQVRLQLGSQTLTRHVEAGTGQGNQNEAALLFGLAVLLTELAARILSLQRPDLIAARCCAPQKTLASGVPMAKIIFGAHPEIGRARLNSSHRT